MSYLLSQSIVYSQSFIADLLPTVYAGSEPALSFARMIVSLILNPPFTWAFNRDFYTITLVQGQQDYTEVIPGFGFLEKVSIYNPSDGSIFEMENVYNNHALGETSQQSRPDAISVQYTGTSGSPAVPDITFRFLNAPDQVYEARLQFQKAPTFFTVTTQDWFLQCGLPESFIDIYNALFVAEALAFAIDERSVQYRQRGMAALLSKSEGLSEMQKSEILGQYLQNDLQTLVNQLKAQQAAQARVV
jgi:hypothetical protein